MIPKAILILLGALAVPCHAADSTDRDIAGWTLHINPELLTKENSSTTERAIALLKEQLDAIILAVPPTALTELMKVELWFSPLYPGERPHAAFHPGAGWLKKNGRNPKMVKSVEFTNTRIFDSETRRMPNFALHELAHAYHNRVLGNGFENGTIKAAYEKAKKGGKYDNVERKDANGRKRMARAYAMTNQMEYFAECTEAYFSTNDFFPYNREQLKQTDPAGYEMIETIWGVPSKPSAPPKPQI